MNIEERIFTQNELMKFYRNGFKDAQNGKGDLSLGLYGYELEAYKFGYSEAIRKKKLKLI